MPESKRTGVEQKSHLWWLFNRLIFPMPPDRRRGEDEAVRWRFSGVGKRIAFAAPLRRSRFKRGMGDHKGDEGRKSESSPSPLYETAK